MIIERLNRAWNCQLRKRNRNFADRLLRLYKKGGFKKHPYAYMRLLYAKTTGKFPHIRHPRDINECLISLNIRRFLSGNKKELMVRCADKYAVRDYVSEKGFPETLNELYGVYDTFDDIPFDMLPNQFVIKMNNAAGHNVICTDKANLNMSELKKTIDGWFEEKDFGLASGEWHYGLIQPKVIVEKYLASLGETSLIDYKFNCYKGHVHSCLVCYDRVDNHVKFDHYDGQWNLTDAVMMPFCNGRRVLPKPKCYDEMIRIASKLSEEHEFVRVDLYEVEGKVLFGELTMTPVANMMLFYKQYLLNEMGDEFRKWNN